MKKHLCNNCFYYYPECPMNKSHHIVYGEFESGDPKDDRIIECEVFRPDTFKKLKKENKILKEKVAKLKQLLLLTDSVVGNVVVSDTQLKQWSEYLKCFPDEKEK